MYKFFGGLCISPNIRVLKYRTVNWAEHVARVDERRGAYRVLVEKPERKRSLRRPRRRWEDNIKMVIQEVEWREWTGLIWLRLGTGGGQL